MLRIEGLDHRWTGARQDTIRVGALALGAGENLFLHGPSGCGKSTLISAIAGVIDVAEGAVCVAGRDIGSLGSGARDRFRADHIGLVFQMFNLVPWLTGIENVILPCTFSRRRRRRAGNPEAVARRLLGDLGLDPDELGRKTAGDLSVGQQQRVAVARALIGTPDLILADEPTSALDADAKTAFLDVLMRDCKAANTALLFVSHDRGLEGHFDRSVDFRDLDRGGTR